MRIRQLGRRQRPVDVEPAARRHVTHRHTGQATFGQIEVIGVDAQVRELRPVDGLEGRPGLRFSRSDARLVRRRRQAAVRDDTVDADVEAVHVLGGSLFGLDRDVGGRCVIALEDVLAARRRPGTRTNRTRTDGARGSRDTGIEPPRVVRSEFPSPGIRALRVIAIAHRGAGVGVRQRSPERADQQPEDHQHEQDEDEQQDEVATLGHGVS